MTHLDEAALTASFERLVKRGGLSPLGALILAAVGEGAAADSRGLARLLDVGHAIVLREIAGLAAAGRVLVERRDPRTMRTWIALAPERGEASRSGDAREVTKPASKTIVRRSEL